MEEYLHVRARFGERLIIIFLLLFIVIRVHIFKMHPSNETME